MDLRQFIRIIRRGWLLIVISTLLVTIAAAGLTLLQRPVYQATTTVFISTASSTVQDLSQGSTFAQQIVKSYADVTTTSYVLQPVIENLGLKTTPEKLAESISASAPLDTTLVNITVDDHSPQRAARIADAVSGSLILVVDKLVPQTSARSSVKITRVQAAVVPSAPISPNIPLNLVLGLLIGLALGLGVAALRDTLDTRIRSAEDVEAVSPVPILGRVPLDSKVPERPLIVDAPASNPWAESFRTLRTNLQYVDFGHKTRSLVVTSSIESEGKSTSIANLAITLAHAGEKVVVVEADLRRPKLMSYLQIDGAVGLTDVLIGRVTLEAALQSWGAEGMAVLPAGHTPPNPSELVGSPAMSSVLEELSEHFTTILIDAPPLLAVTDAAVLTKLSNGAILVCALGRTKRPQLAAAVGALETAGARLLGVVLNKVPTRGPDSGFHGAYGYGYGYGNASVPPEARSFGPGSPLADGRQETGRDETVDAGANPV